MKLFVSEIFKSIQGESTHSGRVCTFIRLSGCNLACAWCDTRYAWAAGRFLSVREVVRKVRRLKGRLVEITGGEPLVQAAVFPLMTSLLKTGFEVLLETNGSFLLSRVPKKVIVIMDVKTPSSGMADRNVFKNLRFLKDRDEIKFVVADKQDMLFTERAIRRHRLDKRFTVLVSPVHGRMPVRRLAQWCVQCGLRVRLNLQLHKIIWPGAKKGV